MKVSVLTLLAIVAFAAIGAALAKVQTQYDGSAAYYTVLYGSTDAQIQAVQDHDLKANMIKYAAVGAGFGLIVGLINDGFRSQKGNM